MELVETRKVAFAYVDQKRKKGTRRVLNSVRMTFNQEDGGTDLYFRKVENGFEFSKEPEDNSLIREVKLQTMPGISKPQKYINMRGIVDKEGIYDIYKTADGRYRAYLSMEKEKLLRKHDVDSNTISKRNDLYIPKKIIDFISSDISEPMYIVEENFSPNCFIRIKCMEKSSDELDGIRNLCQYGTDKRYLTNDKITHSRKIINNLTISRFFMNYANLEIGSRLFFDITGAHEFVIELAREYCAYCGKEIRRRYDSAQKICLCQKANTVSNVTAMKIQESNLSRKEVIQNIWKQLADVNMELTKIMEEYKND